MSLFKQMALMLSLFLSIILISVMVLNFKSASEFVQNQLYTDAKNTAHSLGLSLSKVADSKDTSTMETMINAIYDSGYYQRIALIDLDGKEIYVREDSVKVSDVPEWFVSFVSIKNAQAHSDIMMGWSRFGTLEVSGHTGNAYRQLYSTLIDLIQTFFMIGIVVLSGLYLLLSMSLKSLKRIRDQANAIIDNEFIIEEKIPFTTEFRSVTAAMNTMVEKVKDIFDRENVTLRLYHEVLYKDSESKLNNRRYLSVKISDYLQSDVSLASGGYVLISFEGLDRVKRENGYEPYSKIIHSISKQLQKSLGLFAHSLIARLNENDFFALIPAIDTQAIMYQVETIKGELVKEIEILDKKILDYLVVGFAIGSYSDKDNLKTLFSRADHTVMQSKSHGEMNIECEGIVHRDESLVLGREEWRSELLKSLDESRMLLASQDVVERSSNEQQIIHQEIFLRLKDKDGKIHSAGFFIPIAESLGLSEVLDRYMIEKVFRYAKTIAPSIGFALNLSGDFVKKHSNVQWLRGQLELFQKNDETILWFEVSNNVAIHDLEAVSALSSMVKMFGYKFGIDHFAIPEGGANYLQAIRPDYVKSSSLYLQDMILDNDTGKSRESFNNLIRSLGISVVAMNIESSEEMDKLVKLGIHRFQGRFISNVNLIE